MKRPTKKPVEVTEDSFLLEAYTRYTPEDLRKVAKVMEDNGISSVEFFGGDYGGVSVKRQKVESAKEADIRYCKQFHTWKVWKKKQEEAKKKREEQLIKDAKRIGMGFK